MLFFSKAFEHTLHSLGIAFIQEPQAQAVSALDPADAVLAALLSSVESAVAGVPPRSLLGKRPRNQRKTASAETRAQTAQPPPPLPPLTLPPSLVSSSLLPKVILVPLDIARDVFDAAIAPTLTAPTPLAQSLRQQMYRRMFLSLVSSEISISSSAGITPDSLFSIILSTLQHLGLST